MFEISNLVAQAQMYGIFQFYLPFIILFAIFYAVLNNTRIFGDPRKFIGQDGKITTNPAYSPVARTVNLVISIAAAMYITLYSPYGVTISTFLSNMFGQVFVVIVTLMALLLMAVAAGPLFGIAGVPLTAVLSKGAMIVALLLIALTIGIFISSGGLSFFGITPPGVSIPIIPGLTTDDMAIIVVVVLTFLIIWWVTRVEELKPEQQAQR